MAKSLMRLAIIALVAATLVHSEVTVSFVDNSAGSFFKDGTAAQTEGLSREDLTATISSLLSIGALSKIDAATSEKVSLSQHCMSRFSIKQSTGYNRFNEDCSFCVLEWWKLWP